MTSALQEIKRDSIVREMKERRREVEKRGRDEETDEEEEEKETKESAMKEDERGREIYGYRRTLSKGQHHTGLAQPEPAIQTASHPRPTHPAKGNLS